MKLTLLGTGQFIPDAEIGSASYALEHNGEVVVLDFGRGALRRLVEAEINWRDIRHMFITHRHPDHWSDLIQLLQGYTVLSSRGEINQGITLYGPPGFEQLCLQLKELLSDGLWEAGNITVQELKHAQNIEVAGMNVSAHVLPHSTTNTGFRFEADGVVLAYTGDTGMAPELVEFARNADMLLIECSAASNEEPETHMNAESIAAVAREAGVRRVVLTHYPADGITRERLRNEVAQGCAAEVIAGQDLMTLTL